MEMGKDLVINGTQLVLEEDYELIYLKCLSNLRFKKKPYIFIACQLEKLKKIKSVYVSVTSVP